MHCRNVVLILLLCLMFPHPTPAAEPPSSPDRSPKSLEERLEKYESPLNFGFNISYSPRRYENYLYIDGVSSSDAGHALDILFEWLALKSAGKLGIGIGAGFAVHPNILIVSTADEDQVATLYTVPAILQLTYRGDFIKNQILVPYGLVGTSATLIKQASSFGFDRSGFQVFMGLEAGAGIEVNLNPIERTAARELDQTTGINASLLFAEYRVVSPLGSAEFNLSRKEWRFGLRFEF